MTAPHISRRDLLLGVAALLPLRAQEKTDAKFEAGVNVVNVFASVHNGKNEVVKDLNQDDFSIEEDGHAQAIKYFARETDLPLTLGLMVDTSGSQRRVLDKEKSATSSFIAQVMREDRDKAFLIKFDAEAEEMQELTNSKKKLQSALNDVEGASPRQLQRRDPNSQGGSSGSSNRGGTILYDAVLLASNEEMKKLQGRKAMILLTDGDDHGSRSSLSESIEAAQKSDTLIYSIYFADPDQNSGSNFGGPGMGGGRRGGGMGGGGMGGGRRGGGGGMQRGDGKKVLERMSKETGGAFFEVTKKMPLEKIYERIEEELRSQYNIGYSSDQKTGAGFRKIKVSAKGKGLVVQAREGYYAAG
jgi:VWFA-related protein